MHLKTSYGFVVLFLLLAACMWETVDTMSNQPQVDSWQCPHYHLQPSFFKGFSLFDLLSWSGWWPCRVEAGGGTLTWHNWCDGRKVPCVGGLCAASSCMAGVQLCPKPPAAVRLQLRFRLLSPLSLAVGGQNRAWVQSCQRASCDARKQGNV